MGVLMEPDYLWGCPDDFVPPDVAAFGKRYVKRWQASAKKLRTYDFWRQLFYSAALTRFEWVNLPHGIDARYHPLLGGALLHERQPRSVQQPERHHDDQP